jgi:hypothetical protein
VRHARLGGFHALIGPQLARDLGVRMQWPAAMRIQRLRRPAARERVAALVELDEGALDLPLVRLLRNAREGVRHQGASHQGED